MKSNDIIALSEHWLHANRLNVLNELSNDFNVVARASRHSSAEEYGQRRGQGGVAILWRNTIPGVVPLTELTHDRLCGINLHTKEGRSINIYSVYLPASCSSDDFDIVLDDVADIIDRNEQGTISILCGDFNADIGFLGGNRSNRQPSKTGTKVAKFFEEFDLIACNMQPYAKGPLNTFCGGMGSSCIDFVAIPQCLSNLVLRCDVIRDDIMNTSDHHVVRTVLDISCSVITPTSKPVCARVKWGKIKRETMQLKYTNPVSGYIRNLMHSINWDEFSSADIDDSIKNLCEKMTQCSNSLPKSKYRKHIRPYWNDKLDRLKKDKVKYYRIWKSHGRPRGDDCEIWLDHKRAKRTFKSEIKFVQRQYEFNEINEIMKFAEIDKNKFWRKIKSARKSQSCNTNTIRNDSGKVVHKISEVVQVWMKHFSDLCTEKINTDYDQDHYQYVKAQVNDWYAQRDDGPFLDDPITSGDIRKAVKGLNKGKSPGHDSIAAEHLQHAGCAVYDLLAGLFNKIISLEYIPQNFRTGTQIPLFKGKNLCALDPNSYRGITLLTSLNKVFEMVLWHRMVDWWEAENVISKLQGACKSGSSCVHSALVLQETISVGLDTSKKVFVAYFDVAKAFDSVWIDGLFYQLYRKGVCGKIWRLLYATYQDFQCRVRVNSEYSEWYPMTCGIHQGGFLSLLKYTAFIDPLISELEQSGTGCTIVGIPTSPVGYADDMATCSTSKNKLDKALNIVSSYAKRWRYQYNAKKSAIMVYGENRTEHGKGVKYRNFKIGKDKVKEYKEYDHVGVKNCLFHNYLPRTEDRIRKGRRAFNAVTNVGIRKRGLSMRVCADLFWTIVAPIVSFGSEVWVLRGDEIESLRKFQRYVGRRCQRFNSRSPNHSAYIPLGWMSIDRYIQVKKLLFLRSMTVMDDTNTCKKILKSRTEKFTRDGESRRVNEKDSPIYDILNTSIDVGLYDECMNMIVNDHFHSKDSWKRIVWEHVWKKEEDDVTIMYKQPGKKYDLFDVISQPYYLIWWIISDMYPKKIGMCEKMTSILCACSLLKSHDLKMKRASFMTKCCSRCDLGIIENPWHMIMQCPCYEQDRIRMFDEIRNIGHEGLVGYMSEPGNVYSLAMGKHPECIPMDVMVKVCIIAGKHICKMYDSVIDRDSVQPC